MKVAQRDDGKGVDAWTDEQARIVLENADHFVKLAVDAHGFADRVFVGKSESLHGGAQHDNRTGMLLIEGADEAPTLNRK